MVTLARLQAAFGHDLAESPVDVGEDESLVGELDDDELYVRLRQFGVDVGPVVGQAGSRESGGEAANRFHFFLPSSTTESTRHLYRKKLASLMRSGGGEDPAAHSDRGGDVGQVRFCTEACAGWKLHCKHLFLVCCGGGGGGGG